MMELLLRVQISKWTTHDVRVEADPSATLAMFASELRAHFGISPTFQFHRQVDGSCIDGEVRLDSLGLLNGELLVVGEVESVDVVPSGLVLDVLGGPHAGTTIVVPRSKNNNADVCSLRIAALDGLHLEIRSFGPDADPVLIVDPRDEITPISVDGVEVDSPVWLDLGSIIRVGRSYATLRKLDKPLRSPASFKSVDGSRPFHRSPYRPSIVRKRDLGTLGNIPAPTDGRRLPLLSSLAPLAGGVAMYAFTHQAQFLLLTLLMPLVTIVSWVEDRRSGRRKFRRDAARFRKEIPRFTEQVDRSLQKERFERLHAAPDVMDLAHRALFHSPQLWPRGRDDHEFLVLRAGMGSATSNVKSAVVDQGDAALRDEAKAAVVGSDILLDVPIVIDVAEAGALAVEADDETAERIVASLLLQAATLHSPEDLVILAAVDASRGIADCLKWLPHARTLASPVPMAHVVTEHQRAKTLYGELLSIAASRALADSERNVQHWPKLLVVLDEALEPDAAIVAQLLDDAPKAGITVLWIAHKNGRIPRQVEAVLRCDDLTKPGLLWFKNPEREVLEVDVETIGIVQFDEVARALAPLRDASARNVTSAIPKVVPLFSALGIDVDGDEPEAVAAVLAERWLAETPYSLITPMGLTSDRPLELDLVAQGPHVLIGGTSGSGKSELLVAFVAGLIANHAPARCNLLFIDYKGGAATEVFRKAPHTVGYVTNLSGELAARALISLQAELNRRMRLFEGRAKDIEEMLLRFPSEAPPSLVIVVDEFATLVKEIPEFVSGIVDIAQRGRSLGIHLVLATQSPSGSVDDKIQANTTSRISLRMVDVVESNAVIGTPDAVSIPVPLRGRAIARLGPHELVEFQSAFGGAPVHASDDPDVSISSFGVAPHPGKFTATRALRTMVQQVTQLDVFLRAVTETAERLQLAPQRKPWREALPEHILLEDLFENPTPSLDGFSVIVGRADDPEHQEQPVAAIDLEEAGGLLVFGAGGSGKSTVLRTIAASVAKGQAGSAAICAIDFAAGSLRELSAMSSCANVASGDDLESVSRLIATLENEVQRRKQILSENFAETLSAYHQKSNTSLSRIVLLVDGYASMRETFSGYGSSTVMQTWLDRFHKLVSDGRKVGLHVVITADRAAAVPALLSSAISRRLILRQVNEQGLTDLGVSPSRAKGLELASGRGLIDGRMLVQVACVSREVSGSAQTQALREMSDDALPPDDLKSLRSRPLGEMEATLPVAIMGRLDAVIGTEDVTCNPVLLDFEDGHLSVIGMSRSGRSTALVTIAKSLRANCVDIYLAGSASSPLVDFALTKGFTRSSFAGVDQLIGMIDELIELTENWDLPRVLIVDDIDKIAETPALVDAWNRLARCRRVRVVASLEVRSVHSGYFQSDLLHQLKSGRRKLLLQPADDAEIQTVLGVRAPLRPGLSMPPGRGILLAGRDPITCHIATSLSPVSDSGRTESLSVQETSGNTNMKSSTT